MNDVDSLTTQGIQLFLGEHLCIAITNNLNITMITKFSEAFFDVLKSVFDIEYGGGR